MSAPTADVSVRVAWAEDAPAIAAVQVRAWRHDWSEVLPADRLPDDPRALEPSWRASLVSPGDARRRVLVALERDRLVGFVLTGPATDPDCDQVVVGEMTDLTVDPAQRGAGHGSRLLQAAVDTLVADRFTTAVTWVGSRDDALRTFLTDAGWAADGAHRELALDEDATEGVRQVRLHTSIG
ncbi:GNAT family N-acetyltransferase [Nocardioides daphniae]|uniref:N-acetyltransferase n=1 Tax=Nocardioides daphniae TaxID=402297 RepID=A0A4P7UBP3_9ACTN|nr:GNAT family N-acetyltransferase [Nocardioides daphniae]QCC76951.1 N-acetyltransferase [Nocardioides daphniae]GGD18032.1 hypothetical protein GCM10007231_16380 [Nocardioides daphniae]